MARCTEWDEELGEKQGKIENVLPCDLDAYRRHYPNKMGELLRGQGRRKNETIEVNHSLEMNGYERNCGLSEECFPSSSGSDCPGVDFIIDRHEFSCGFRDHARWAGFPKKKVFSSSQILAIIQEKRYG